MERNQDRHPGLAAIAAERRRQVDEEGFTARHDATVNVYGQLVRGALCYLRHDATAGIDLHEWPWDAAWWKPSAHLGVEGRRKELAKAGALLAAEYDRTHPACGGFEAAAARRLETEGTNVKSSPSWLKSAVRRAEKYRYSGDGDDLLDAIACTARLLDGDVPLE